MNVGLKKHRSLPFKFVFIFLLFFLSMSLMFIVLYKQPLETWGYLSKSYRRVTFRNLMENKIYKSFNVSFVQNREKFGLILIISTAPKRINRRQSIRETWWSQCSSNEKIKVKCVFMTDRLADTHPLYENLTSEAIKYNDIVLQKEFKGIQFGNRFLYHMVWAMQNYRFDYFMRMDDDIMLCAERFIQELPLPAPELFHWGWVHCIKDLVRPEESIILLSRGLVERFLWQQEDDILCHPWADQMIGAWMNELNLTNIYHHDKRAYHHPPASFTKYFKEYKDHDICDRFISVHGSYPKMMKKLWGLRGGESYPLNGTLLDYSKDCDVPSVYKWNNFGYRWNYEPKRCITEPVWDTTKQGGNSRSYGGREGKQD